MQYRRFGKTEIQMPVISCGGMRYQDSWTIGDPISDAGQRNLEATIRRAVELGVNHIETARGYGTSEEQLGRILPTLKRDELTVQTKGTPKPDVAEFIANFEDSMARLKLDYVDLFSVHGINTDEKLEWAMTCLEPLRRWQKEGRIRHVGFSTHGPCEVIVKAIETGEFDYVNLHWFYIAQQNWPAVEAAARRDMGVFIISPNDKGGKLYEPPQKLVDLCAPLHPMVFNGLYCLAQDKVHTLSCGAARPEDFDIHMETVAKLDQAEKLTAPIVARLEEAFAAALGADWAAAWDRGLPKWQDTPGDINIPIILQLYNLARAYDMVDYGRMRYNLLGNGDDWFPGMKAGEVARHDLTKVLAASPHAQAIPQALAEAHALLDGEEKKRLQS